MVINSIFIAACFLLSKSAIAVDINKDVLAIGMLESNATLVDGKVIILKGYVSGTNGIYFAYESKASADVNNRLGVDIVESPDNSFLSRVVESGGSCGVVTGRFTSFTDGVIGLGNFRSDIGYLVVSSFKRISCKEL